MGVDLPSENKSDEDRPKPMFVLDIDELACMLKQSEVAEPIRIYILQIYLKDLTIIDDLWTMKTAGSKIPPMCNSLMMKGNILTNKTWCKDK